MGAIVKIKVNCPLCNKMVDISLDDDLAKGRDYYPFEYLNIHGCPEHAMMLYIDENLTVRESVVYEEIDLAMKKVPEIEEDPICSICLMDIIPEFDEVEECPNKHKVHKECLEQWLKHSNSCPKCHSSYVQSVITKCSK